MVYSATEWMVDLTNLAFGGCRGESCACPGAVSRAVAWEPLVRSLCMRQLEDWADGGMEVAQRQAWRCLVVLGSHSAQMVAQQRGWLHRADGDGGDALHWSDIMVTSRAGAG
jgi:hypothetical protein